MAMNIIEMARARARAENSPESTEAGQPASPQRAPRIVIRSASDREPVLFPLPGSPVASQRKATVPGSPFNHVVEQAGNERSNQSGPRSPLPTKLVRRINRLAGDDNDKSSRALLRLHGDDAVRGDDPLAPLNIEWLISTEDPVAPGESSRAAPPPGCMPLVESPPSLPASAAAGQRKQSVSAAEAFFHHAGPGDDKQQFAQWLQAHPLHQMFRQVYPIHDAISLTGQNIRTPVHAVLESGISDPTRFHHSLMQICEQADGRLTKPATLFLDAVAVSRQAAGPLQKKADFFSRFFSALIALEADPDPHEKTRISETLRQEWLETDFSTLLGLPEASPLQEQWQTAEPSRAQVPGRRSFADAMGPADMSPRKKRKTVHHQEDGTPADNARQAPALPVPDSPRHSSPQRSGASSAADLSPPSGKDASAVKLRSRSWKSSALKRRAKLPEREFNAWLANIAATDPSALPVRTLQSPLQQAGDPPGPGTTSAPVELQEKPLSD